MVRRRTGGKNKINDTRTTQWDDGQREIIAKYKRAHLIQQETERLYKEITKQRCRELDPRTGFPKEVFIYNDAMTSSRGDIPKYFAKRTSNKGDVIENRLFGVEVICGKLSFIMFVSTNQLVKGGANLIVEMTRLTISKLAEQLQILDQPMPKVFNFQFDNCGENKNITFNAYVSLLIELGHIDCAYMNFLIVGHTHDSLDQIFSVLSNKINDSVIATIPAMHELYSSAHSDYHERPWYVLQLEVVHDWSGFFSPFINTRISRHSLPHRFKVSYS